MSIHRMFESVLNGEPFPLWGEGRQRRSFTFVDDIVEVFQLAGSIEKVTNRVLNAGGAEPIELNKRPGDPELTCASKDLVMDELGWKPKTSIDTGLRSQLKWHNSLSEHFHTLQKVG